MPSISSPRILPLVAFAAAGASVYYLGIASLRTSGLVVLAGGLLSCLGAVLQPTPLLRPLGGSHHVGLRYVSGNRGKGIPSAAVYYPTSCPPALPEPWLPDGDLRFVLGAATVSGLPSALFSFQKDVKMLVARNASLLSLKLPSGALRPLVVMSHGLGSHKNASASVAMDLAARGAIVFCVQHCDGSTVSVEQGPTPADAEVVVQYEKLGPNEEEEPLRVRQLNTRINEVFKFLNCIADGSILNQMFCSLSEMEVFMKEKEVEVVLAGHSFGAATALAASVRLVEQRLSNPTTSVSDRVKVSHVVCNDLWHIPLSYLLHASAQVRLSLPPVLLQESIQWDRWVENKQFEDKVMPTLGITVRNVHHRTDHLSFTDFGILSPVINRFSYALGSSRPQISAFVAEIVDFVAKSRSGLFEGEEV